MELKRAATLVRIRTLEQDIALSAWGKAQQDRQLAEHARDEWAAKLNDWAAQVGSGGVRTAKHVREQLMQLSHARVMLDGRTEQVDVAKVVEAERHSEWQQRKQRQEGVIRLHDRVETELRTAELQQEQMLIDDITSTRHQRRGEAT